MSLNLRLMQIADSALPISGYTHSWGLESAIAKGVVNGPESLERWTSLWLRTSLGPLEGVILICATRAVQNTSPEEIKNLNDILDVSIAPPTIRNASREMGTQLLSLATTWNWCSEQLASLIGPNHTGWHHAVIFGILGSIAGCDAEDVLAAYLHQSAVGVVSAGLRAIPVGHTHGQQILTYLHDDITELTSILSKREAEEAGSACPYYEVLCDEQTRLYARMFRS